MLKKLGETFDRGVKIQEGVSAAFVGLPNAGKSSFFNALLGEDRSIVSAVAGTTRDVVREKLSLKGKQSTVTLRIADTAGLRDAKEEVEQIGVERTLRAAKEADVILLLVDASQLENLDALEEQWRRLGEPRERTVGIFSKSDLVKDSGLQKFLEKVGRFNVLQWCLTSAVKNEGISEAAEMIAAFCESKVSRDRGEVVLTRLDQLEAVKSAVSHLQRAKEATQIELLASDLRQALLALSPLMGETRVDEILGRVFSQFCIGK